MLWAGWRDPGSRIVQLVLGNRDFQTFIQVLLGGGRWGSNPRPADYENYGPVHRAR